MHLEDLRVGASVYSRDDRKLGTLSKFIVRESSLIVTHIVVDTGILRSGEPLWKGGWGLSHDRVLPLAAVASATSDRISLTMDADEFRDHSVDYEQEYFVDMPDNARGPDLSDLARIAASLPGEPGPYIMLERRAIAPGEVEIPRDAPVWRLKPHEKIGDVDRVVFEEQTGAVQGLVVKRGLFFKREVTLPPDAIVEVVAGVVRIDLDDEELAALPEFEAPD